MWLRKGLRVGMKDGEGMVKEGDCILPWGWAAGCGGRLTKVLYRGVGRAL